MRFSCVEEYRDNFPANFLYRIFGFSTLELRVLRSRPTSRSNQVLLAEIKEQSSLCQRIYGRPHMIKELQETDLDAGLRRIGRMTRQNGMPFVKMLKLIFTTRKNHNLKIAEKFN